MRIGFPGMISEVPYPASGMGFGNTSDNEVTELANGGRHVYNAPTTFKSFNMTWRSKTSNLQPLLDLYNRRYGNKAFHILDPNNTTGNLLPPRWAYSYQLAHIARGQGQPFVDNVVFPPQSVFNDKAWGGYPPAIRIMVQEGRDHYLKAFGTRTGAAGVRYRLHNPYAMSWGSWTTHVPTMALNAPQRVLAAIDSPNYDFIELQPVVPSGGSLSLEHMDFATDDYRSYDAPKRPGQGVGALRFTNTLDGELVSSAIERIGLSVDITEVEVSGGW